MKKSYVGVIIGICPAATIIVGGCAIRQDIENSSMAGGTESTTLKTDEDTETEDTEEESTVIGKLMHLIKKIKYINYAN